MEDRLRLRIQSKVRKVLQFHDVTLHGDGVLEADLMDVLYDSQERYFTLDQIATACVAAEVNDSKFEAICIALEDS